jgi:hypothetical protein
VESRAANRDNSAQFNTMIRIAPLLCNRTEIAARKTEIVHEKVAAITMRQVEMRRIKP